MMLKMVYNLSTQFSFFIKILLSQLGVENDQKSIIIENVSKSAFL
jgi:hypothetical protein